MPRARDGLAGRDDRARARGLRRRHATTCAPDTRRSRATRNNALGFLMAIFQKLNSSSSYAIRQSLLRRIEKLEAGLPTLVDVHGDRGGRPRRRANRRCPRRPAWRSVPDKRPRTRSPSSRGSSNSWTRSRSTRRHEVLIERLDELAERRAEPQGPHLHPVTRHAGLPRAPAVTRSSGDVHLFHGQLDCAGEGPGGRGVPRRTRPARS